MNEKENLVQLVLALDTEDNFSKYRTLRKWKYLPDLFSDQESAAYLGIIVVIVAVVVYSLEYIISSTPNSPPLLVIQFGVAIVLLSSITAVIDDNTEIQYKLLTEFADTRLNLDLNNKPFMDQILVIIQYFNSTNEDELDHRIIMTAAKYLLDREDRKLLENQVSHKKYFDLPLLKFIGVVLGLLFIISFVMVGTFAIAMQLQYEVVYEFVIYDMLILVSISLIIIPYTVYDFYKVQKLSEIWSRFLIEKGWMASYDIGNDISKEELLIKIEEYLNQSTNVDIPLTNFNK